MAAEVDEILWRISNLGPPTRRERSDLPKVVVGRVIQLQRVGIGSTEQAQARGRDRWSSLTCITRPTAASAKSGQDRGSAAGSGVGGVEACARVAPTPGLPGDESASVHHGDARAVPPPAWKPLSLARGVTSRDGGQPPSPS